MSPCALWTCAPGLSSEPGSLAVASSVPSAFHCTSIQLKQDTQEGGLVVVAFVTGTSRILDRQEQECARLFLFSDQDSSALI